MKKILAVYRKDKVLDEDISPKPSMFLPSVSETNVDKAGTYICLLEKFFPEPIKVSWKEKDNDGILESQQGDTVKINNTYMKLSWLTVTGDSMSKEHKFIVKHENNKGRGDQEIVFPPIKKVTTSEVCLKNENGLLGVQLTSTSAYYTYLLLLLKSALHGAFILTAFLGRWSAVCRDRKRT
uniref:T cell receptor gamma constant 1 n=2 Tax=Chinchilla lanigera TaxID=34839 RepID=A0A8C2V652_CHILA